MKVTSESRLSALVSNSQNSLIPKLPRKPQATSPANAASAGSGSRGLLARVSESLTLAVCVVGRGRFD